MKTISMLAVAALSLAFAASASAQTVIRITGSTAFRSNTHAAIAHLMGASGGAPYTLGAGNTYGYRLNSSGSTDISNANIAIFKGTINSQAVIVKVSWSGSAGGILTVSQSLTANYIPDNPTTTLTATGVVVTDATVAEIPNVAMSDTAQATTVFTANELQESPNSPVGVVPFVWVASYGAPAGLSNVTVKAAQALFGSGTAALALFTGNSADQTSTVYSLGRDPDSGTRLSAFAEVGLGANASVTQFEPVLNGTTKNVDDVHPWPATTINGIAYSEGNGGYASGSGVADALRYDPAAIGGYFISYLGVSDATRATSTGTSGKGNAKELTYDGVPYSLVNVQQGKYTFWTYERLLYRSGLSGVAKSTADAIALQIKNVDSPILLSTMKVERQVDGGTVFQNY